MCVFQRTKGKTLIVLILGGKKISKHLCSRISEEIFFGYFTLKMSLNDLTNYFEYSNYGGQETYCY